MTTNVEGYDNFFTVQYYACIEHVNVVNDVSIMPDRDID